MLLLGKSSTDVVQFNKNARDSYQQLGEDKRKKLTLQAETASKETVYLSRKRVQKEGQKIFEKIGKDVSLMYSEILLHS